MLLVKVDSSLDSSLLPGGRDQRLVLDELLGLVRAVAPEGLVAIEGPDALALFLPDLTHGSHAAETIRLAIQELLDADDANVDRMHWRPVCDDNAPVDGVTVGAVRVGRADELSRASARPLPSSNKPGARVATG